MFHIADPKDIKAGKYTEVYFTRTVEVLKAKKIDKWASWNSSPNGDSNRCSCRGRYQEILFPLIQNHRVLQNLPTPQAIRKYVLQQLLHFDL